jgi:2-iminobutanoate/2-iminopropanoate deaminase
MTLQKVATDAAPQAIGPYSQAVISADLVFCSGQIAMLPGGTEFPGGDVAAQARRALENLRAVLEEAGSSLALVVKTTVYLTDMDHFSELNEVYAEFFGDSCPARATVAVSQLPKGALVEIDAIARRG